MLAGAHPISKNFEALVPLPPGSRARHALRNGGLFLPFAQPILHVLNIENKMTTTALVERLLIALWIHITPHGDRGTHEALDHGYVANTLVHWAECCHRANAGERTKAIQHA